MEKNEEDYQHELNAITVLSKKLDTFSYFVMFFKNIDFSRLLLQIFCDDDIENIFLIISGWLEIESKQFQG